MACLYYLLVHYDPTDKAVYTEQFSRKEDLVARVDNVSRVIENEFFASLPTDNKSFYYITSLAYLKVLEQQLKNLVKVYVVEKNTHHKIDLEWFDYSVRRKVYDIKVEKVV